MSKEMKLIMENWNKFVIEEEMLTEVDADLQKFLAAVEDNVEDLKDEEGKQPQNEFVVSSLLLFKVMTTGAAIGALIEFIFKKMKKFAKEEYRLDPEIETNEEKALEKAIKVTANLKNSIATLGLHTIAKFLLPKVGLFNSQEAQKQLDQVANGIALILGLCGLVISGYTSSIKAAAEGKSFAQGLIQTLSSAFDMTSEQVDKLLDIFDNASDIKQAIIASIKAIRLFMTGST